MVHVTYRNAITKAWRSAYWRSLMEVIVLGVWTTDRDRVVFPLCRHSVANPMSSLRRSLRYYSVLNWTWSGILFPVLSWPYSPGQGISNDRFMRREGKMRACQWNVPGTNTPIWRTVAWRGCLGVGQPGGEGVPSQCGRGDTLVWRMFPSLTWPDLTRPGLNWPDQWAGSWWKIHIMMLWKLACWLNARKLRHFFAFDQMGIYCPPSVFVT